MSFFRRASAVAATAASTVLTYYAYQHWKAIAQYPAETGRELRRAVRAEREGRSGDAERCYHEALQSCERGTGRDSSILIKMADFYRERGSLERAASIYESVLAIPAEGKGASGVERRIEVQKALGDVCVELEKLDRADGVFCEILTALECNPKLANEHAVLGPVLESVGDLRFKQGRFDAAAEAYKSAARHCAADVGAKTQAHVTLLNNVASCQFAQQTAESLAAAGETAGCALGIAEKIRSEAGVAELIANLRTIAEKSRP